MAIGKPDVCEIHACPRAADKPQVEKVWRRKYDGWWWGNTVYTKTDDCVEVPYKSFLEGGSFGPSSWQKVTVL